MTAWSGCPGGEPTHVRQPIVLRDQSMWRIQIRRSRASIRKTTMVLPPAAKGGVMRAISTTAATTPCPRSASMSRHGLRRHIPNRPTPRPRIPRPLILRRLRRRFRIRLRPIKAEEATVAGFMAGVPNRNRNRVIEFGKKRVRNHEIHEPHEKAAAHWGPLLF